MTSDRLTLTAISVGGALGSVVRWGLSDALGHDPGAFTWSTLIANLVGSFALGALVAVSALRWTGPLTYPFLGVGVLGGFTTFSTFTLDARETWLAHPGIAILYVVSSLVGGIGLAALGHELGRVAAARGGRR